MLTVEPHPLLDLRCFATSFANPLGETASPESLIELLSIDALAPMASDDQVRTSVRDLLRHGGFKPTGRSKPASEYLIRAANDGALRSISLAVDACNAVSLHSGLPISVIDLDLANRPLRVGIAETGSTYVFNQAGQVMDLGGLLCLFDEDGPCANAVKDSQRTKTNDQTRRTLSLIWGTQALPGRAEQTQEWYCDLLTSAAATVESVDISRE
ncbi:MAG: hypothetical protein MI757_18075 [Pirellulales bacterium]|nr:hypothetical protein [Pirellulales bacterium]